MWPWFQSLEKRYALNTIGFLIAVASVAFAVYVEYFRARGPAFEITIQSEFDVFSLKEDIPELQVTYNGIDLRSKGLKLRVVTFEVRNDGPGDLALSAYDPADLPGITVEGAKVLRLEKGKAGSEYLQTKFQPRILGDTIIEFPPSMMDAGDHVSLKALLLAETKTPPILKVRGKVLGVRQISLKRAEETSNQSFWAAIWTGGPLVHVARAAFYAAGFVAAMLVIFVPTAFLTDFFSTRKRRRTIVDFKSLTELKLTDRHDFIFQGYESQGDLFLAQVERATASPAAFIRTKKKSGHRARSAEREMARLPTYQGLMVSHVIAKELVRAGFVNEDDKGQITVNGDMRSVLEAFIRFLRGRQLYHPRPIFYGGAADAVDADFGAVDER
jgi:hypothetical protein